MNSIEIYVRRLHCHMDDSRVLHRHAGAPVQQAAAGNEGVGKGEVGRYRRKPFTTGDTGEHREIITAISVRRFPFFLQGGEKVRAAVGAEKFVVFDHGGGADPQGRQRRLDADHAGAEADADCVRQGDVRRESQRDLELGSCCDRTIEIEEDSAGADVLRFGMKVAGAFEAHDGGQAHVEAPHHPPFLLCESVCMRERSGEAENPEKSDIRDLTSPIPRPEAPRKRGLTALNV